MARWLFRTRGVRVVVGTHLNKWFTLEGEGYYAKIKVNGTAAGDRSAASAIGAMINGLVRKDYKRVSVWGGVGVGLSRNTAFDYERYIVTSSGPTFRTQLKGIGSNRFATQLKIGMTHTLNDRLDLTLSASHLTLGRFSRIDISDPNLAQVPFRASVTSINFGLQFKI